MRVSILGLLFLAGCANDGIGTSCIGVHTWTHGEQQKVLQVEQKMNSPELEAFLEDYGRMRAEARVQCAH